MLLTYELLGLAVLYVVWTIYKAVMDRSDRRKEFEILLMKVAQNGAGALFCEKRPFLPWPRASHGRSRRACV
jgi:hypothetical protein